MKFSGKFGIRGQQHKRKAYKAGNPCRCTGSQEPQHNKVLLVPQVPHQSLASWMDTAKPTKNTPALCLCCPRCPGSNCSPAYSSPAPLSNIHVLGFLCTGLLLFQQKLSVCAIVYNREEKSCAIGEEKSTPEIFPVLHNF